MMGKDRTGAAERTIVEIAGEKKLDAGMLYQTVIELAAEGLLTAKCLDAAAGILLTQLGLPDYFFSTLSGDALKRMLRAIAGNLHLEDGELILRSEVSAARFDVDGGVQARIATPENLERMEAILNPIMAGNRIDYYFGKEHQYYTYVIHPEVCKSWEELAPGESPFAFNQIVSGPVVPPRTRRRYETFLRKSQESVVPLVEVSRSASTQETRIMFREDFDHSILPTARRILGELDITLNRAYWETYRTPAGRAESLCSLYLEGTPGRREMACIVERLHALLAIPSCELDELYVTGVLTFEEFIFAGVAAAFVHSFIHSGTDADRDIMEGLERKELRDAMARRLYDSDRAEFTRKIIIVAIREHPELLKRLFALFDRKFNPRHQEAIAARELERELEAFRRRAAIVLAEDTTAHDVFIFMARIVTHVYKTSFFKVRKRSCAFRLDPRVLDPLVFRAPVHGLFFVVGFHAVGTHMRAADVARGGLRLIRVTPGNYDNELDAMPLLDYALGPVAQRLKHKDIAESGAKGVILPGVEYARDGLNAVYDFSEGIMDLIQPSREVRDYLGVPEMIFFGPDEGTAPFMDAVAQRSRQRGYRHWRTLTTGKTYGVPHDEYGLLQDGRVFGLIARGAAGTELEIDGHSVLTTPDVAQIRDRIGDDIDASGMTTMGVVSCLRRVLEHVGLDEREAHMMITGGPDGDLGANQIQSARGPICLLVDGGSVLFDPEGLDRDQLLALALARHAQPRLNSLRYPTAALGKHGFRVSRAPGSVRLPDGTAIEDGAYFHRSFLSNVAMRARIEAARIQVFVPCGGLKDTIHAGNVHDFLELFGELRVIVEGANVFFDDTAREVIARESDILQIRDSTANKGGVTCSAIAEVLAAFLLGDDYESVLVEAPETRSALIRAVLELVRRNADAETRMLLRLHEQTGTPLYTLSMQTSEQLLDLQQVLFQHLGEILPQRELVTATLRAYIPGVLLEKVGMERVLELMNRADLRGYRDAIITKKLAALALYQHAADWDAFMARLRDDLLSTLSAVLAATA